MKRKYIFILFGAVALFSLLLIGYMMYNSYSLPIQGEEVRKEWLCTNNKMKIVFFTSFGYDNFYGNELTCSTVIDFLLRFDAISV